MKNLNYTFFQSYNLEDLEIDIDEFLDGCIDSELVDIKLNTIKDEDKVIMYTATLLYKTNKKCSCEDDDDE